MQHEPNEAALDDALAQNTLLHLMINGSHPWPWSVAELAQAHGDHIAIADAIANLHATGLIHLNNGYAWPTLPATTALHLHEPN